MMRIERGEFRDVFVALHESGYGTSPKCRVSRVTAAYGLKADSSKLLQDAVQSSRLRETRSRLHDLCRDSLWGLAR
jgi:hypothetical protein